MRSLGAAVLAGLCTLAGPALAHVTTDPGSAAAGSTSAIAFRVGHGCDGATTTALRVEIPAQIASARVQPKAGWTIAIEHQGSGASARVSAVTWKGALPDSEFDQFAILMKLPATPGVLYFPAVQTCGKTAEQWTEIPDSAGESLSHPAPKLTLGAAPANAAPDPMAGMAGM